MRLCGFSQARPEGAGDWIAPVTPGPVVGLREALLVTLPAAAVGVLVGGLLEGSAAAWGVVAGTALLVGFYVFGLVTVQVVASLAPALSLLVALLTYTMQVAVLALVFLALQRSGALEEAVDGRWLGVTVIIGTLAWTALLVRGAMSQRIPHYHTAEGPAKSSGGPPPDHPEAG